MSRKIGILENVTIEKMGAEGYCIAKVEGRVFFVEQVAPGDVVDLKVVKKRKKYFVAQPIHFHQYSKLRVSPFCQHFGTCGGCKWQHINYQEQANYKRQQVIEQFQHIGDFAFPEVMPTIKAEKTQGYRGKMEFSASNKRWLTPEEMKKEVVAHEPGLGLHIAGFFDKILDIQTCRLQPEFSDKIRNEIKSYCTQQDIPFYDIRAHTGWLRAVMIRNTTLDQWMVLVVVGEENKEALTALFEHLIACFPQVNAWLYAINDKVNDALYDLSIRVYHGKETIEEKMENLVFQIGAKSFFQTNPTQSVLLYQLVREMANLKGTERVYDLYTGTGSIACFIAEKAKKVIGIESVPEAIEDAKRNAKRNGIDNVSFFVGDMKNLFSATLVNEHGKPDVVITDPPRIGMHRKVLEYLLTLEAPTIIYISCHPATQARDLSILCQKYEIHKVQPVDMFPHTHHVENVVQLKMKTS